MSGSGGDNVLFLLTCPALNLCDTYCMQQCVYLLFRETSLCRLEIPLGPVVVENLSIGQSSAAPPCSFCLFVFVQFCFGHHKLNIDTFSLLCVISKLYGDQARFFDAEKAPRIKHRKKGTVSMVNNGNDQHGSQVNGSPAWSWWTVLA